MWVHISMLSLVSVCSFPFLRLNWRNFPCFRVLSALYIYIYPNTPFHLQLSSSTQRIGSTTTTAFLYRVFMVVPLKKAQTKDILPRPTRVFMCELLDQAILFACFKPYYTPAYFTLSQRVPTPTFRILISYNKGGLDSRKLIMRKK